MRSILSCAVALLVASAVPAFAGKSIDVVGEGGIRDKWMLKEGEKLAVPAYPPGFAERKDDVCVSVAD